MASIHCDLDDCLSHLLDDKKQDRSKKDGVSKEPMKQKKNVTTKSWRSYVMTLSDSFIFVLLWSHSSPSYQFLA